MTSKESGSTATAEHAIDSNKENGDKTNELKATSHAHIRSRLESDLIISLLVLLLAFALHVSTIFNVLAPFKLKETLFGVCIATGFLVNYVVPHLRMETPWHVLARPLLRSQHHSLFEPNKQASLELYERAQVGLAFAERNVLLPLLWLACLTESVNEIVLFFLQPEEAEKVRVPIKIT